MAYFLQEPFSNAKRTSPQAPLKWIIKKTKHVFFVNSINYLSTHLPSSFEIVYFSVNCDGKLSLSFSDAFMKTKAEKMKQKSQLP